MRIYSKRAGENRLFHFARSEIDSYGISPKKPMYLASLEIQRVVIEKAKEVFSE